MSLDIIQIGFQNWEKYNPRSDRKNFSWFRFENDFFSDPIVFSLSINEKIIFIFLLCEASKDCGNAKINAAYASVILGINNLEILVCIDKLKELDIIKKTATIDNQKTPKDKNGWSTNERTDVTNDTNEEPKILISESLVIELYNAKCSGQGKLEIYRSFSLSGNARSDFLNRIGSENYKYISIWEELFDRVIGNKFLCGEDEKTKFVATLPWILRPDNFEMIISGGYQPTRKVKSKAIEPPPGVDYDTWFRQEYAKEQEGKY